MMSKKSFLVTAGLFLLIVAIVVAIIISRNANKSEFPLAFNENATDNLVAEQYLYYQLGQKIYKYDVETGITADVGVTAFEGSGGNMSFGQYDPAMSRNEKYIAYFANKTSLYVLNQETSEASLVALPKPNAGNPDYYIAGFSKSSDKLLIYVKCEIDLLGESASACPSEFDTSFGGFYTYNADNKSLKRLEVYSTDSISDLVGWANYDNNAFLVSETEGDNQKVYEVNTESSEKRLIKTIAGGLRITVWDSDKDGNLLYEKHKNNNAGWELYINDKLIHSEKEDSSMQLPRFVGANYSRIAFYITHSTVRNASIITTSGGIDFTKDIASDGFIRFSVKQYRTGYITVLNNAGLSFYRYSDWTTILNVRCQGSNDNLSCPKPIEEFN